MGNNSNSYSIIPVESKLLVIPVGPDPIIFCILMLFVNFHQLIYYYIELPKSYFLAMKICKADDLSFGTSGRVWCTP